MDHARRERTGADATPQDEDGDVVDVTQAAAGGARGHGAVNSKCPLTMKDVFDLEDPTADVKGYVYERAAIVEYVRRQAGRGAHAAAQCPAAGTNHAVRVAELRPAWEVFRAKKRAEAARRVAALAKTKTTNTSSRRDARATSEGEMTVHMRVDVNDKSTNASTNRAGGHETWLRDGC